MNERSTFRPKQRQLMPLQAIPTTKKPYLVRGMADTVLHLTAAQVANRDDLIPQFESLPISDESLPLEWIESDRW